jgi:biopolymer transport protein TolR
MGMGVSGGEKSGNYTSGSSMSEINVTPFVDVMLVLLIIFMVSAPLMQQGVQVDLPQTKSPALDEQEESTVLTVKKDKKLFIEDQELDPTILAKQIAAIFEHKRNKEIYVQADQSIPYGFVAQVMADLKNAGIERVGLVTEPQSL